MLRLACRVTAILLAAASVALAVDAGTSPNLKVSYDKEKDSLSVEARAASLRELLTAIGQKGGFVPRIDQDAEKPVTIKFSGLTVEQGLSYIGEEASLNYALFVSREPVAGKGQVRRISGMYVVYAGKGVAAPAHQPSPVAVGSPSESAPRPVQALPSPASSTSQYSPEELDAMRADATRERMEKRLAKLPPEERERKIKAEEERLRRNRERMTAISNAQQERKKTILEEGGVDPNNP